MCCRKDEKGQKSCKRTKCTGGGCLLRTGGEPLLRNHESIALIDTLFIFTTDIHKQSSFNSLNQNRGFFFKDALKKQGVRLENCLKVNGPVKEVRYFLLK